MSRRTIGTSRGGLLPRPSSTTRRQVSQHDNDYEEWERNIMDVAHKIIYVLAATDKMRQHVDKALSSRAAVAIWTEAFTAPDVSMVNYERQEFVGDAVSKAMFSEYLYTLFPNAGPDEMTSLRGHYTDNEFQGELVAKLANLAGIDKPIESFMRRNMNVFHIVPIEMRDDLYESIYNAVYMSGNAYKEGIGYVWAKEFTRVIYKGEINYEDYSKPSSISRLGAMFVGFAYPNKIPKPQIISYDPEVTNGKSHITTVVKLNSRIVSFLRSEFVTETLTQQQIAFVNKLTFDQEIGRATEMIIKKSRREAAANALRFMEVNIGIDDKWVKKNKERWDNIYINKNYNGLADKLMARLKENGFVTQDGAPNYEVDRLTKFTIEGTRTVSTLVGIRYRPEGDQKVLLDTYAGGGDMFIAKVDLFRHYLEKK